MNGTAHPGSLSEGAGSPQGLTEGVSSDGCFGPMVYSAAIINSETFDRLRSSYYTPSVSHSLDSSLPEGAGKCPPQCQSPVRWMFCQRAGDFWALCRIYVFPFNQVLAKPQRYGRFSSPLRRAGSIHRSTLPQSRFRSTAPSEREPGNIPHNANHPPAGCFVSGRVIFGGIFTIQPGACETVGLAGDFHRPYETQKTLHSTIH